MLRSLQIFHLENAYNRGFDFVFRNRGLVFLLIFILLGVAGYLAMVLPLQKVPPLKQVETVMVIDWNENIHLDGNMERVLRLMDGYRGLISESGVYGGRQQFLLNRDMDLEINHSHVYIRCDDPQSLTLVRDGLSTLVRDEYPLARISFESPSNVFDRIFESQQPPLVARFTGKRGQRVPEVGQMREMERLIGSRYPDAEINPLPLDEQLVLRIDPQKLLLYRVDRNFLYRQIRTALDQYEIGSLRSDQTLVPVVLGDRERVIDEIIATTLVRNSEGANIPVTALLEMTSETGYKTISAGREGEYLPVVFSKTGREAGKIASEITQIVSGDESLEVTFAGSWWTFARQFQFVEVNSLVP